MTEQICWHCKKPLSDEKWIDDEEYGDVHTRCLEEIKLDEAETVYEQQRTLIHDLRGDLETRTEQRDVWMERYEAEAKEHGDTQSQLEKLVASRRVHELDNHHNALACGYCSGPLKNELTRLLSIEPETLTLRERLAQVEQERNALREHLRGEQALDKLTDRTLKFDLRKEIEKL